MTKIVYPGTFDPVTLGHLDVIRRGAALADELIVAVGENPGKSALFTLRARVAMIRAETRELPNVSVKGFTGLLVDFARREGATVVMRGIRTVTDLEYEVQMAFTNRASARVETIFIAPSPEYAFVNARFIKEIARGGGDVSSFVTPAVAARLRARSGKRGAK